MGVTIDESKIEKGDIIKMTGKDDVRELRVKRTEKKFLGFVLDDDLILYDVRFDESTTFKREEINHLSRFYDLELVKK